MQWFKFVHKKQRWLLGFVWDRVVQYFVEICIFAIFSNHTNLRICNLRTGTSKKFADLRFVQTFEVCFSPCTSLKSFLNHSMFWKCLGKKQSCLCRVIKKKVDCGLPADLVNKEIGVDDWGQASGKGVQRGNQLQPKQEIVLQSIQFMPRI